MPVDFTRRPHISGKRKTALKVVVGIMIAFAIVTLVWSILSMNWLGVIFPILTIVFFYLIFPGWYEDFYQWFMIKVGLAKKMRPRTWRDDNK